ncbi:MAG: AAA family ATPase [Candidatus Magasanikbacteria bacterium]|nr:AAA family ATPase [Candidatus Magasanikbacteria bacterium]
MYLKQVDIHGFKSFAKKTTISFLPPKGSINSITAIVGPNGSGKSNVSDAIRWVLGEQSMKQLRGKKSADIIFAGSVSKGKMGMASVSLTVDNNDGGVPIDYSELVITRRLYRSGESEYLINGAPVRLLDLQILLAKAQFGHGSYSVVGQGMIDKLILQSATERKQFFDEASGIKEFQIKRHQAALKLNRTKEHMKEATLLLQEIAPRLKTLTRQVKKLEERQGIEVQLQEMQESYYRTLYTHNQSHIESLKEELHSIEASFKKEEDQLKIIQTELSRLAQAESRQHIFQELQRVHQDIVKRKNELERDRAILDGRLQTEYSKAGKQNIGWLEQKINQLNDEYEGSKREKEALDQGIKTLQQELHEKKGRLENIGFEKAELKNTIATLEQRMLRAKTNEHMYQFTGIRAVQAILEERQRFGKVYGAVAQLGRVDKQFQLAMDVAAGSHLSSLVVENDEIAKRCVEYLREYRLGYATFLPLNKMRPRFVSQDIYACLGKTGVHGLAIDLIEFKESLETIFSYVFGGTLIVEDIDTARKVGIGKVRMVTVDGDILETSGSIKGGYRKRKSTGLSFAHTGVSIEDHNAEELESHIREKNQELQSLEKTFDSLQEETRSALSQLDVTKHTVALAEGKEREKEAEIANLKQELSLTDMSPEEYSVSMKDVSDKKGLLEQKINDIIKEVEQATEQVARFNEEEEQKKKRVFSLQDAMQYQQGNLNKIVQEKNIKEISLAKFETKQEDLIGEVFQEMHTSAESIIKKGDEVLALDELEVVQSTIQKLKYKLSLIGGIDEEVIQEHKETKERHDGLDGQLYDLKKAMKDLDSLIEELDSVMKKKRKKAFKAIREEFARYFSLLFEGGKADLVEVYGEEDLEEDLEEEKNEKKVAKILTGIDIIACPPGKKITNIRSLSGGERTMTSIALICAILRTNPSPFVVLDEVEAALDEANSLRFTNILQELAKTSQFILITHNRATMHAADALYGVTMGRDGISQLLSVNLDMAQKADG